MKKFGFGNLGSPLAVLLLLSLLVLGCRKDFAEYDSHQSTLSISVEEVRQMMGDPSSGMVSSRSPIKVPLDYTPNWDNAILNTQTGAPLVIAAVDTCCIPPDMPVKGNLIFRKDSTGTINCSLMLWFKSSDSTYVDWRAPLWTQNTFSGLVALVDAQDTIRRVASYANGSISKVLVWNKNIRDLAEDELGAPPTVEDRGGDEPGCAKWGPSAWDKIVSGFWHVIDGSGSFFNDWWDSIKENPGPPPQEPYSFFFYEFSNSPNWTWIPVTGGGGGAPTEFENYRVDCGIAMQNFIANGFYLPEYAHLDMRLCELLSELYISDNSGATNIRLQCLYANHQSAYFEDIWQYWDNSGKDQAASTVLNSFLDAACEENPSVQKAAMLRHAYCLGDMNLIDLWNRLTVECGQNFGLEISPCLAEIILSHANTSNSYQCPNGALANIINFARQHGLTAQQFIALVQSDALFQAMQSFMYEKGDSENSRHALKTVINLQMHGWFDKSHWTESELEQILAEDFSPQGIPVHFYFDISLRFIELRLKDPRYKDPCDYLCKTKAFAEATWDVLGGWTHTALDICGLIPAGGEPCDLINGVLYTFEGDGINASLSFGAAIPIAGWAATGAKWAGISFIFKGIKRDLEVKKIGNYLDFGTRGKLREVLNITDGIMEAHHIIPWELRNHELVQRAAQSGNVPYHINHFKNGKELEKFRIESNPNGQHANHPQYNTATEVKMDNLWRELKNHFGPGNVPADVASAKLIELQNNIGAVIDANPTTKINLLDLSSVQIPSVP